jgi:hypothetical protein
MIFANGICLITENVQKLAEFYKKVLRVKVDINDIHVEIAVDGGIITIYSKAAAISDRDSILMNIAARECVN